MPSTVSPQSPLAFRRRQTAAYYTEFGLTPQHDGWSGTRDGGRQLQNRALADATAG